MTEKAKGPGFLPPEPEPTMSPRIWLLAALAVLITLVIAALLTLHRDGDNTGEVRAPAPYATQVEITALQISEATNGTGGKATYVDGTLVNKGSKTLTAVNVQVTFSLTDGNAPHREILPLALVRTREPYVDLQPVSAAPVKPGESRDFRLIFDAVPATWDVKVPEVRIVRADVR